MSRLMLLERLPESPAALTLLDVSFHLKFVAYRDGALREQLHEAWSWCFRENKPSRSLALRSAAYAENFASEQRVPETLPGSEGSP